MFKIPTTLILGAEASNPYGYTGEYKLKKIQLIRLKNMFANNSGWIRDLKHEKHGTRIFY